MVNMEFATGLLEMTTAFFASIVVASFGFSLLACPVSASPGFLFTAAYPVGVVFALALLGHCIISAFFRAIAAIAQLDLRLDEFGWFATISARFDNSTHFAFMCTTAFTGTKLSIARSVCLKWPATELALLDRSFFWISSRLPGLSTFKLMGTLRGTSLFASMMLGCLKLGSANRARADLNGICPLANTSSLAVTLPRAVFGAFGVAFMFQVGLAAVLARKENFSHKRNLLFDDDWPFLSREHRVKTGGKGNYISAGLNRQTQYSLDAYSIAQVYERGKQELAHVH